MVVGASNTASNNSLNIEAKADGWSRQSEELSFADLDELKGIPPLEPKSGEEFPLPKWYRSIYRKPLCDLSVEDLCKACRQGIHCEGVVPLVVKRLEAEPLAGEMFEGELLVSLSAISNEYWAAHTKAGRKAEALINRVMELIPDDVRSDANECLQKIKGMR